MVTVAFSLEFGFDPRLPGLMANYTVILSFVLVFIFWGIFHAMGTA